ncbi:HD domain-containing protein [Priestia aryabhattai]|uniref:HD domain-containing protein n=1 Tax=Priestia aryabhattai TaxID=412384 RepID=UPI003D7FDFB5
MFFLTDKLNKSILDPIHGLIRMTEEEMKIISHSLFNRLRKIKQNTFLYYVFPSANHTRFEHSIGVMHLASEMFLNAFHNANTLKSKRNRYGLEGNRNILDIEKIKDFESLFYDLRIAALLHDIGHGPMSHLFDEFAPSNKEFLEMLKNEKTLIISEEDMGEILVQSFEKVFDEQKLEEHVEHEFVSYYFALIVLKEVGISAERIKRILSIMNSELALSTIKLTLSEREFDILPLLNHIVAGAPLDCDRMDYLLRDSYFSGVKYGTYDLNRLLKSLLPYIDDKKGIIRLGIKKSGLPAIENFLQARYELYIQVYFHKTNQACNAMLTHATRQLKNQNFKFIKCNSAKEFRDGYLELSDEQFLKLIRNEVTGDDRETINDLLDRKLWKRIIEIHPEPKRERKEDIEQILDITMNHILNNYKYLESFVKKNLITNNPLKDLEKQKAVLLVKDEDENYTIASHDNWIKDSKIFKALSSNYLAGRIYMRVHTEIESDKENFRKIKKEIQRLVN